MPSKETKQRAPPPIHSDWHHHPRRSHSQQQLTYTDTRNRRWKNSAPGTNSYCQRKAESTQQTHTPPPPPVQSRGQRDTATAPQTMHNAQQANNHPLQLHVEADPPPSMTRRPTPYGYTGCTILSIQLILCLSLENASFIGGSWKTKE
ncbi:exo-alpha-sialidase [Trypanosoma cruzi]|nr:exo-alpha-sialidase [Trypanosoma cruzi]